MLDLLHLPKPTIGNVDYFFGSMHSTTTSLSWQTWEKPKGITMIRITCIGGGGAGGNGFPSTTITARGGGGGGGSGGFTSVIIPANLLPDRLYVTPGRGGTSALTGGTISAVTIFPYGAFFSFYTICYADSGSAGNNGASSGSAGGGAGGPVATRANTLLSGYGEFYAVAGQAGSSGGSGAGGAGTAVTYPTTGLLLSGGSGGGGGTSSGGGISWPGTQLFPTLTAVASGVNGLQGRELYQPLLSTGGTGGGAATSGATAGGNGGNAGFGSGGGGGGAAGSGGGGLGGNGGNGLVIIQYW